MLRGLAIVLGLTPVAAAQPFTGAYFPDGFDGPTCGRPGLAAGTVVIETARLIDGTTTCFLASPTPVRDLPATLFDADCFGQEGRSRYRLMLAEGPDGTVYLVRRGEIEVLRPCFG